MLKIKLRSPMAPKTTQMGLVKYCQMLPMIERRLP